MEILPEDFAIVYILTEEIIAMDELQEDEEPLGVVNGEVAVPGDQHSLFSIYGKCLFEACNKS